MDEYLEFGAAFPEVPAVMQEAMKTLAHTSTSLLIRLRDLEGKIESERLRSVAASSQILDRIQALAPGACLSHHNHSCWTSPHFCGHFHLVCAVTSSTDGHGICSSHIDGSIHRFFFHQVCVAEVFCFAPISLRL